MEIDPAIVDMTKSSQAHFFNIFIGLEMTALPTNRFFNYFMIINYLIINDAVDKVTFIFKIAIKSLLGISGFLANIVNADIIGTFFAK